MAESAEIKKLIKLRKQRPAFSRMISWEISQSAEHQPVKKLKQKKKKACGSSPEEADENTDGEDKNTDDSDADSNESSDYETACEDESEIVEKTEDLSVADIENQYESFHTDILEVSELDIDADDDDELNEEDDLFMPSMGSDTVSAQTSREVPLGRRRRLSKKQKRKRKKYLRVTYIDDLYCLGNLFDATDDINDVFTEVLASGPDVEVRRKVPTLVELCMKVNRRKQQSNSEKEKNSVLDKSISLVIPYGMKKLLSSWAWTQKQLENQLSFFLNKVLPLVEEKMKNSQYVCEEMRRDSTGELTKDPKPPLPKRSVWTVFPFPPVKMLETSRYRCEKTPTFLFSPSMHFYRGTYIISSEYAHYYINGNVCLNAAMWALATTIDLMLPSQTYTMSPTTMISRVKRALSLRYKHLVDILFDKVLPYVMWARGKVAIATDMFRNLLEKETQTDEKAMYLSEIARMRAMFGDSKTAEQFYRLATETALEDLPSERRDKCINEATEQKQILLASIYDTGVLDREKAIQSYSYWTGVKNLPTVRTKTMIAGLDALVCYHLSHCTGSNLYDEAISKLEKMTKECKYAYYYQSLLHALQGSVDISTRLYWTCRSCYSHTPGDAVLSLLEDRNPWQPLIDLVNTQTLNVKPLEVVWRTNLQPPRVTKNRPMEAQVNSPRLNLCLNEAGHVTGDMQMMLPPMRDISLDPYTGSLMIDNIPSHTGMWTSAYLSRENFHILDLLVPTPMLIYSGEDGTTVHMVKPSNSSSSLRDLPNYYSKWPSCSFMLYWTGPDGHMAKLNLHTVLKNHTKQKLKKLLEQRHKVYIRHDKFTESDYKMMFKFLDIGFEKNYALTKEVLSSAVRTRREVLTKGNKVNDKSEKIHAKMPQRPLITYLECKKCLDWELTKEPFVYGKTVVLQVKGTEGSENMIFANTEDKLSFLSCTVKNVDRRAASINHRSARLINQGRNNYTDEDYFIFAGTQEILVLNNIGNTVLSIPPEDVGRVPRDGFPFVIIYPKIYGVHKQKCIWCADISLEKNVLDPASRICWKIDPVYDELAQGTNKLPAIIDLTYIGRKLQSAGKLLVANLTTGLAFMDPNTMEFVTIKVKEGCARHFEFTTGNNVIKGDFEYLEILAEKAFTVDNEEVYRVAFGVQNKMFVLDLSLKEGDLTIDLEMIFSVELPGLVKEVCFVGKQVGMLVSLTQHYKEEKYYKEHVFYFDYEGLLHGVLLCLDHGPRSFLPVYLHGNKESEGQCERTDPAGWYVYLRDGRDGIMCVRLCK